MILAVKISLFTLFLVFASASHHSNLIRNESSGTHINLYQDSNSHPDGVLELSKSKSARSPSISSITSRIEEHDLTEMDFQNHYRGHQRRTDMTNNNNDYIDVQSSIQRSSLVALHQNSQLAENDDTECSLGDPKCVLCICFLFLLVIYMALRYAYPVL